jgi:hypothetical protein
MTDQNIIPSTLIKKYFTTEYLTAATFFIYGWGLLYNYLYYRHFEISIISYLSLQEVLLDTIIYISSIIIIWVISQFLIYSVIIGLDIFFNKKYKNPITYINKTFLDFTMKSAFLEILILIILICVISNGYTIVKIDNYIFSRYLLPVFIISSFLKSIIVFQFTLTKNYFKVIYIISVLIIAIRTTALWNYKNDIKVKPDFISHYELINGKSYSTSENIIKIG